jgi:hypothetical protein
MASSSGSSGSRSSSGSGGSCSGSGDETPQPASTELQDITLEFVASGQQWPAAVLELAVRQQAPVVDRTLQLVAPQQELLQAELPLVSDTLLQCACAHALAATAAAAAAGTLTVCASRPDVSVSIVMRCPQQQQQRQQQQQQLQEPWLRLRHACGPAGQGVRAHVWLYADSMRAKPLQSWAVAIQPLQRVDMRARIGQQARSSLAIAGGSTSGLLAAHSAAPDVLAVAPALLEVPAGGVGVLTLAFSPRTPGQQWVSWWWCLRSVRRSLLLRARDVRAAMVCTCCLMLIQSHRQCSRGVSRRCGCIWLTPKRASWCTRCWWRQRGSRQPHTRSSGCPVWLNGAGAAARATQVRSHVYTPSCYDGGCNVT